MKKIKLNKLNLKIQDVTILNAEDVKAKGGKNIPTWEGRGCSRRSNCAVMC